MSKLPNIKLLASFFLILNLELQGSTSSPDWDIDLWRKGKKVYEFLDVEGNIIQNIGGFTSVLMYQGLSKKWKTFCYELAVKTENEKRFGGFYPNRFSDNFANSAARHFFTSEAVKSNKLFKTDQNFKSDRVIWKGKNFFQLFKSENGKIIIINNAKFKIDPSPDEFEISSIDGWGRVKELHSIWLKQQKELQLYFQPEYKIIRTVTVLKENGRLYLYTIRDAPQYDDYLRQFPHE